MNNGGVWAGAKAWGGRNRWALGLAAAAVVARGIYLASVTHDPFFGYLRHIPDAFFFNNWAQEIASGDWLGDGVFFIGPLYAYFLGIIYKLIGPHLTVVRLVHIALDGASAVFIYGFGRRVFGEWPARVAGILWVVYLPAIFFSSFILPVSLDVFLITASFYFLARGVAGRRWNFAAAGTLVGVAALDRANLLLFAAAAVPVFLIYLRRLGGRRLAAYFLPLVAILFAVTLRNGLVAGDWVVVSSQGGVNFFLGNSATATGTYWNLGEIGQGRPQALNRDLARVIAEERVGHPMKASAVSRWWMGQAFSWLRGHPGDAARLYAKKLRFLLNDFEVSLNVDYYFMKFVTPFHRVQLPYFGFVLPFAVLGWALGWRRSPFPRTVAAVFVVAYGLSVMAFFISARYRLPMVPLLLVFAGAGFVRVIDEWRAWRWRTAAALTVVAMAVGTFAMWPLSNARRDGAFGQSYYRYGKFYFDAGEYEKAVSYFRRAMAQAPEIYYTYVLLGIAYERLGQSDTAMDVFRRGVLVAPYKAEVNYNYGVSLVRAGRAREALPFVARATALAPDYLDAWFELGEVYIGLGDFRRAEGAYRQTLRLAPENARFQLRMAEILTREGRTEEALPFAHAAAAAEPSLAGANYILGRWYYQRGDYQTALTYLSREVDIAPASAPALALLAGAHMKLGHVAQARAVYRTYLSRGGRRDLNFERDAGVNVE